MLSRHARAHLKNFLEESGVQGTSTAHEREQAAETISRAMLQDSCKPTRLPWRGLRGVSALAERIAGLMGPRMMWRDPSETPDSFQWTDERKLYTLNGTNMWDGWTFEASNLLEIGQCKRHLNKRRADDLISICPTINIEGVRRVLISSNGTDEILVPTWIRSAREVFASVVSIVFNGEVTDLTYVSVAHRDVAKWTLHGTGFEIYWSPRETAWRLRATPLRNAGR